MPAAKPARTLDWAHKKQRARLIRNHRDGTPCPCLELNDCGDSCPCRAAGRGLPMYQDPARNPDRAPLEADHTIAWSQGGRRADRLLLRTCNRSRGDGTRAAAELGRPSWWTREWTGTTGA